MSSHGNLCHDGQLRGSIFPVKILLVSVNTLPAEHATSNALVVMWSEERTTLSSTERDRAQTERVRTRLVVHSPSPRQPSVSQVKKRVLHSIHGLIVSSCVVFSRVTRTTHMVHLWVFTSRMVAELGSTGSILSRPLMSCVQGWWVSMTSDIKTFTLGKPKLLNEQHGNEKEQGFGRNQDSQ